MKSFKTVLIIASLIVLLIVVITLIYKIKSKANSKPTERKIPTTDHAFYNLNDERTYRKEIYRQVPVNFEPYIRQLFQSIDNLKEKALKSNSEISQAQYNAMKDIFQTADRLSKTINDYWYNAKFKKDFSYYIGLHYASHLLANALKIEQQNIKSAFVNCKNKQDALGSQIEIAKRRQARSHGEQRLHLSKYIGDLCQQHKNISLWKNQIGSLNTQYNQRVTQQNIKTGQYRDYIANNFGERGKIGKYDVIDVRWLTEKAIIFVNKIIVFEV